MALDDDELGDVPAPPIPDRPARTISIVSLFAKCLWVCEIDNLESTEKVIMFLRILSMLAVINDACLQTWERLNCITVISVDFTLVS